MSNYSSPAQGAANMTCQSWRPKKVELLWHESSQGESDFLNKINPETKMSDFFSDIQI